MSKNEQLINKLEQMVLDGLESHIIDKELEKQNLPNEERKEVFAHIQEFQLQCIRQKQAEAQALNYKILGYTFLTVGLGVTLGTFLFSKNVFVVAYGAVLFGVYVLFRRKFDINIKEEPKKNKSIFDKGIFRKL